MGFICVIFQNGFFGKLKTKRKIEKTKEKARKQIVFTASKTDFWGLGKSDS